MIGVLAEGAFGFHGAATPSGDPVLDLQNAHASGQALLVFMVVPWCVDLVLYTALHWTYATDVQRAVLLSQNDNNTIENEEEEELL